MTSTDIAVRPEASAIPAKLAYAKALAESGLLPASYRKQPANVLWAAEYGDMIGIPTMAAITGVHVIDGKPGASAGLISGLVRRAGHKLHVHGDGKSATCRITRSDDPGHPFEVTWTLRKNPDDNPSAEEAKLLSKDVWQKYPASMLKARAISQCARDACEEVLFGLHYTPEELGAEVDEDGVYVGEVVDDAKPAPVRIEYGPRGSLTIDPDCLVDPGTDDGQSWYRQALRQAKTFTDPDEGPRLYTGAAEAHVKGLINRGQQDEIQNIARTRTEKLRAATPVDVEALAKAAHDAAEGSQEEAGDE